MGIRVWMCAGTRYSNPAPGVIAAAGGARADYR